MNHSEGYRIWKIEVLCREDPLQRNEKQVTFIIYYIYIFKLKKELKK